MRSHQQPSLAYFAGLIDGDGCITFSWDSPAIYLKMKGSRGPRLVQKAFGGQIYKRQNGLLAWWLRGEAAKRALAQLLPYLWIKTERALDLLQEDRAPKANLIAKWKELRFVPLALKNPAIEYLAGIFDAEGSISIHKRKAQRIIRGKYDYTTRESLGLDVSFTIMQPEVANVFQERFGGSARNHLLKTGRYIRRWHLTGHSALAFLKRVTPHLRLKKEEAKVAIRFQSGKKRCTKNGASKRELRFRQACADRIRQVRQQGYATCV